MNNNKLSTGIKEIDKELSKGSPLEEFVKFHIGSELQPYQKQLISFIFNKRSDTSLEDEFRTQLEILSRRRKSVSNTLLNQLCNNGSVMINTSIVSKENESEIVWTIIDDPYIKRD